MVDYDSVATNIFKTMLAHNLNRLQLFDSEGKRTVEPEQARRFWSDDLKLMVHLDDKPSPGEIKVNVSANNESSQIGLKKLFDSIRGISKKSLLQYTLKTFGKELSPKDFAYQTVGSDNMEKIKESSLSRAYGSTKSSFQNLDSAKLIIRHTKPIDEGSRGSRARNISALFVENSEGERFRYPYNHLAGARAMTRHVAEGGTPYDNVGSYVTKLSEETFELSKFNRYARSNNLVNEDTGPIIENVRNRIRSLKETLKRMSSHRGYATQVQTLGETKTELDEELVNNLKDKFTVVHFDESIESVLPYVANIVSEMTSKARIKEDFDSFMNAVNEAEEIQVSLVEDDDPEHPSNLTFENVTKKNQHIIRYMSEHILDKNISSLANQVASDYSQYDTSMKNQALRAVKGIMSEKIQPEPVEDSVGLPDLLVNSIDDSLSKYATDDVFFEKDTSSEDEEQVEEGKLPPGLQAHIDAKKDKEDDEELSEDNLKDVSDAISSRSKRMKITELDESLWVGDEHKITTQGGKKKFHKRRRSAGPADINIKGGKKTVPSANVATAKVSLPENTDATLDSIVERYPTELESIIIGNSFLTDHDKFYNELYEYFVTGAGRGEMPYDVAKARDGDPDQWITEYLEQEYGHEFSHSDPESMDGDFDSGMASAGHGTDEDYGYYGETAGNQMRKYADIISDAVQEGGIKLLPPDPNDPMANLWADGKDAIKKAHKDKKIGYGKGDVDPRLAKAAKKRYTDVGVYHDDR